MKVYPAKATAMALNRTRPPGHPTAGPLNADGSDWPEDGFTFRMLVQGIVTEDGAKAWKGDAPAHTSSHAEWTAWAHKTLAGAGSGPTPPTTPGTAQRDKLEEDEARRASTSLE